MIRHVAITRLSALARRRVLQGASTLALLGIAPHSARAQSGGTLRVRVYADMQNIDPAHIVTSDTDQTIDSAIFSRLINYRPGTEWAWELDAAESIEQVDPLHVNFRLRPGIKWTNGFGEMTAEDVKFSFERIIDPEVKSEYIGDWSALDYVEVHDTYSGTIVLKEPYAPLFTTTLPWGVGAIVCKKAMEGVSTNMGTSAPASSGPYFLKEWTPQQRIVLARNPDYYGTAPAYDEIAILPIADDKVAEAAFEAGDLDFTLISVSSIPTYKDNAPKDAELIVRPSQTYYWIGMNTSHELFKDIRVRQAIQYAVDVDQIIEAAFFGVTPRGTGIIAPGLIGHRERNAIEKPDLAKAKALLAEAGYPDGFKCTLSVLDQTDRKTACQVIQSQLAEIGVEVEILTYESGTYWSLGVEADGDDWKNLQLMFLRYTAAPDPAWASQWFTCDQVGIWNWERVCNEEYSELNAKARTELDPAKRDAMYVRMMDLMEESGAYIFVTYEATAALSRNSIVPGILPDNKMMLGDFRPA